MGGTGARPFARQAAHLGLALLGRVREYHRFMLKERREDLQFMEAQILCLDKTLSESVDGE